MLSPSPVEKPVQSEAPARPLLSWLPLADFFHLDTRSLALFRVFLGLLLLCDYTDRLPDLHAHYSDEGIVPRTSLPVSVPLSVHVLSGSVWWQGALMAAGIVFAVFLLVGWRTRFALFLSWFLLISLHARNPAILAGGDGVLRLALFWSLFLPLGARFSVDAARSAAAGGEAAPDRVVSLGSAAFILQICLIYWFASAWKWDPVWRTEGTAVFLALNVDHLTTRLGRWLLGFPDLLRFLTFATVVLETVGPVCLFLPFATGPLRVFAIVSFVLFHAGLGLCMALSNFAWVCMAVWLVLLPTWFWDRLGAWLRTPERLGLTVRYDATDAGCVRGIAYLRTFLCLPEARWIPSQEAPPFLARKGAAWAVVDREGKTHYPFEAIAYLLRLSPLWWPLGALMRWAPLNRAAAGLYQRLAARPASALAATPAPPEPLVTPLGLIENTIVLFCLAYVTAWNVRTLDYVPIQSDGTVGEPPLRRYGHALKPYFPAQVNNFGIALALDQSWDLFAPAPGRSKGWYVVVGTLKDGRTIDLRRDGAPVSWDRPELISATYPNGRWRKFMQNLPNPYYAPLQGYYAAYLCREWSAAHPAEEQLQVVEIYFMGEDFQPDGTFAPARKILMYRHLCFPEAQGPSK